MIAQVIKDFAGPIATIIASLSAAYVTFSIQKQNQSIKRDEIRLSLFEKRYAIFSGSCEYLQFVLGKSANGNEEIIQSQTFARLVSEASFTCGNSIQKKLSAVQISANSYLSAADELNDCGSDDDTRKKAIAKKRLF